MDDLLIIVEPVVRDGWGSQHESAPLQPEQALINRVEDRGDKEEEKQQAKWQEKEVGSQPVSPSRPWQGTSLGGARQCTRKRHRYLLLSGERPAGWYRRWDTAHDTRQRCCVPSPPPRTPVGPGPSPRNPTPPPP